MKKIPVQRSCLVLALLAALLPALLPVAAAEEPERVLRFGSDEAPSASASAGASVLRQELLEAVLELRPRAAEGEIAMVEPVVTVRLRGQVVGQLHGQERAAPMPPDGVVQIAELDPANPWPEVLLSSFTGGAHCCNSTVVLTSTPDGRRWRTVTLDLLDGGPEPARDPLGDGRWRIVTVDNRFLYRFACYACSVAPVQVLELRGENFVDVSAEPRFRPLFEQALAGMQPWFQERDPNSPNGFLAGWVATRARLGEAAPAWAEMLRRYEASSDWGLTECRAGFDGEGRCLAPEVRYPSFPAALRAFLLEAGYLTPADLPAPVASEAAPGRADPAGWGP
ncbi:MAG: hypothetical protein ACOVNL_04675 [Prochlorococcaceae cyanobacterium]|jgi:hypothetical protein